MSWAQALTTSSLSHVIYREELFGTFMFSLMTTFNSKAGLDSVKVTSMLEVALQDISLFSFGSTTEGLGDLWKFCRSWAGSDSSKQEPFFLEIGGRAVLLWNVQGRHGRLGLSWHFGRFDLRLCDVHLSITIRTMRRDGRSTWNFQSIFTQPYMSCVPPHEAKSTKKKTMHSNGIYHMHLRPRQSGHILQGLRALKINVQTLCTQQLLPTQQRCKWPRDRTNLKYYSVASQHNPASGSPGGQAQEAPAVKNKTSSQFMW